MTVKIKKIDRMNRVSGRPGFPGPIPKRVCLHPDRSQARVGRVPGRPAKPVRVLKHWRKEWMISFKNNKES